MNFHLDSSFVDQIKILPSPFVDNIIGDIVYKRTYARVKDDGTKEQWWETVLRVVNGTYSLQKDHIIKLGLGWNEEQAQKSAKEMFNLIFNLKFSPPGRGLWVMGTDIIHKKKLGMALNNCSFVSTKDITNTNDPTKPFRFLMDVSMLGVGCGADTKGSNKVIIYQPTIPAVVYTIDDTREGWVDSVSALLNSYFNIDHKRLVFDYTKIRKEGERLKTFGGISSGPAPLIDLHKALAEVLDAKVGSLLDSTTIVDIFNLIGKAVVSGNVRRCIPKGTLIHTTRGLIPIEDIKPYSDHTVTSKGSFKILDNIYQGSQKTLTLYTNVSSVEVSTNHKMKLFDGSFKPADQLVVGDKLMMSQHVVNTGSQAGLDEGLSWFLGYYHGNGTTTVFKYKQYLELIKTQLQKMDINYIINESYGTISINEVINAEYQIMFTQPTEQRMYFLGGIFNALSISNELYSSNRKFLEDIQSIYASVGIRTKLMTYLSPEITTLTLKLDNATSYILRPYSAHKFNYSAKLTNNVATEYSTAITNIIHNEGFKETYDLTVETTHEFVIGSGFYVSNSAEIMFGEPDDVDFLELKNYEKNPQRMSYGWTSNNSIFATIGMDYKEVAKRISFNGEPGLAWLETMKNYSRLCDPPDYKDTKVMGGNPCFPADTCIMTNEGIRRFEDLIDTPFVAVVDGKEYPTDERGIYKTGCNQQLYKITLSNGISIRATYNHVFHTPEGEVPVCDMLVGETELLLSNNKGYDWDGYGTHDDGYFMSHSLYKNIINSYEPAPTNPLPRKVPNKIPLKGSRDYTIGFLKGLFDLYGKIDNNHKICLKLWNYERVQQLLYSVGISSYTYDDYLIIDDGSTKLFNDTIGIRNNFNLCYDHNSNPLFKARVVSIVKDDIEDVYCCTVLDTAHTISVNGIKAKQCLEQSLESYEVCCLVETFPARHDTIEEFMRTLKFAYLYAKTVTLEPTNWIESTRVVMRNRRIGCSVSGVAKFLSKHSMDILREWLDRGYNTIQEWDKVYSDWLCIPRSIKTTSVKPSGTVSLLADEPPGVHFPNSPYYYRRIRVGNNDPLLSELCRKGYHIEPCYGSETTTSVVRIPKFVGEGVRTLDDVSMWEQMALAAFMQKHWADNQVSCTVTFNPETEGKDIESALNIYQYQLKGISLLPRCDGVYPQMPYEKITKEQYEKELADIIERQVYGSPKSSPIKKRKLEEQLPPDSILYCDGDKCMI